MKEEEKKIDLNGRLDVIQDPDRVIEEMVLANEDSFQPNSMKAED
jgi:hypothetical protein